MKDVQSLADDRGIDIQKVGVKDVHLPFQIMTKDGGLQGVLANLQLTVEVPRQYKGTHMSRFIEILSEWSQKAISSREMESILRDTVERLDASRAHLDIRFKYFIPKKAPVSGLVSLLDYDCRFSATLTRGQSFHFVMGLEVPFTSVCPCSKEISVYGAHNQRGLMKVRIQHRPGHFVWIEDLAQLMENQASCPVYPLLKREDEKYVTERAYENPKFVEDILRDLVLALRGLEHVQWFEVECENYESIHNHSAYASHLEGKEA